MDIKTNNIILGVTCVLILAIAYEILVFPAEYIKLQQSALLVQQDALNVKVAKYNDTLANIKYEVSYYRGLMLADRARIINELGGHPKGKNGGYKYIPAVEIKRGTP